MTPNIINNDYWKNRNAYSFDKSAYSSGRVKAIEKISEIAKHRLAHPNTCSLELGCGSGLFSEISGIRNMTGIDFSQTLLDVARQRMDNVLLQSVFSLQIPKSTIDNIVSLFLIDDYPSTVKEKFFLDIFSLLNENGHLFFAAYTPNDEGIKQFHQIAGYNVYIESGDFYKELLTNLGFSIEVFYILKTQGKLELNGVSQCIQREYILIDAVKRNN